MIGLIAAAAVLVAGQDDPDFEKFKARQLEHEDKGEWKKIKWQKDLETALKKAKEADKPVFVFFIVGHLGKKDAAEC
ncbi:MAG TPA: hypothetical protein VI643_03790 [Planctomycetota bacterium]|nr:hypothetical protein [Planctomycetota bacterium]